MGRAQIIKRGRWDVFTFPRPTTSNRTHPNEKSIELLEEVLSTFALPGAQIYSPFLGSGNTILAAANTHMHAQGSDLGESYREKFILNVSEWTPKEGI